MAQSPRPERSKGAVATARTRRSSGWSSTPQHGPLEVLGPEDSLRSSAQRRSDRDAHHRKRSPRSFVASGTQIASAAKCSTRAAPTSSGWSSSRLYRRHATGRKRGLRIFPTSPASCPNSNAASRPPLARSFAKQWPACNTTLPSLTIRISWSTSPRQWPCPETRTLACISFARERQSASTRFRSGGSRKSCACCAPRRNTRPCSAAQ